MCGFWVVLQSVSSSEAHVHCATAERGSIAFGMSLWCRMRSLTTTSAASNAASTSPPAMTQLNAWLFGASSCSCGAPSSIALSGSMTTGSGS